MNKQNLIKTINKSNSINLINIIKQVCEGFHNHTHILYDIATLLDKKITYLEIGAYHGSSAALMASHPSVEKVVSIDTGIIFTPEEVIDNVKQFKHKECKYSYLQGNSDSKEVLKIVNEKFAKIDILFIDADHSYNAVIADYNNYKHLVSSGGVIVFDDYRDSEYSPQVRPAVDFLAEKKFAADGFKVIGSLVYDTLSLTNHPIDSSNEFIITNL